MSAVEILLSAGAGLYLLGLVTGFGLALILAHRPGRRELARRRS